MKAETPVGIRQTRDPRPGAHKPEALHGVDGRQKECEKKNTSKNQGNTPFSGTFTLDASPSPEGSLVVMSRPLAYSYSMLRSALILTIQLLPCLGLILFGWGFDSLPAFLMSAPRAGLVVVTLTAATVAAYWKIDFNPLRKGTGTVREQSRQLGVLLLLSLALLWFLPFAEQKEILRLRGSYWPYVGLLLFTVGVIVRVAALKALGENFSAYVTLQPNHRLVQNGIYAWIRHPLYLSLLLIPPGIALVFASLLAVPILVLALAFVSDRMRREDRLLASHFGTEFEDYRSRTRKLIPLLF